MIATAYGSPVHNCSWVISAVKCKSLKVVKTLLNMGQMFVTNKEQQLYFWLLCNKIMLRTIA